MASKLTASQRLDKAHVSLLRDERTLVMSGILMMGKSTITNSAHNPTACTDGLNKMYDEKFVGKLDDDELRTLVMHENLHVMFKQLRTWKHLWDKSPGKANKAADYVVNAFIKKLDPAETWLTPIKKDPGIWLYDAKYDGMDVGEVFRLLPDDDGKGGGGAGGGMDGHDWEMMKDMDPVEAEQLMKEIDQALRQGAIAAGKISAKRDRNFDELMEPKVDWRKALREFVQSYCDGRDESTWRRPNRRWLQYDVYMPSMQGIATGEIFVGIDTSGSTYVGGMLEKFLSEMKGVAEATQPDKLHVAYWEHEVAGYEVYERSQIGNLIAMTKPKGGGGTTVSCVTRFMEEKKIKPKAAVILTDGYVGSDWGGTWPCPVLWVIIGAKNARPPCGVVVHAED